ncbi:LOW QUALITY PROTEIN: Hypothetical protein PHPALM_17170 [Phytophthora palmivora]|uniref:Uncharacterized protein n=1 Tax=Phytophthora palmivora TaxID=4796 RepID=A0A2P4XMW9_9STRA|nr:LOW QUALITY PROTEIN: Hypothetical protein PHPALM_17170 [Phytophthora palmivora]
MGAPWADRDSAAEPVMSNITKVREYSDNSCATNVTSAVTEHCVTQDPATTCTPSVTVQSITASNENPATDQETGVTDQGAAVLSELNYWYIYDQNYAAHGQVRLRIDQANVECCSDYPAKTLSIWLHVPSSVVSQEERGRAILSTDMGA